MLIGLGFMRLEPGIPVLSNCSLTLSAACHPITGRRGKVIAFKPLQYRVLMSTNDSVEHSGFDSEVVGSLLDGHIYN